MLLRDHVIAHYKMNENTSGDNDELVTNGDFANWTADNPDGWVVSGESGDDPEISEAATGESHADTPTPGGGMCNLYTSDGTPVYITQVITTTVGKRYSFSINVDTITAGGIGVENVPGGTVSYTSPGIKTIIFIATGVNFTLLIKRRTAEATDVTFDDISLKLCAIEDSSGNDHDGVAQNDSSVLSVPGKINTALEFNGVNPELIVNGDLALWTADHPDSWTVTGESGDDPEISEAATGESHADTPTPGGGMANFYTSDGTLIYMYQSFTCVVGRKYRVSLNIDTRTAGQLNVYDPIRNSWTTKTYTTTGIKTFTFVATATDPQMRLGIVNAAAGDITVDYISVKAVRDYITIPDHNDFTPALTPLSISAWINMDDASQFQIASKGMFNVDAEWVFRLQANDRIYFQVFDESVADCLIGRYYNTALTGYQNQWIHVVAIYDGGTVNSSIKIYLNGVQVDDADDGQNEGSFVSAENLAHDIWIGRYSSFYANGTIDNLMFFNKELTPLEVQLLYNGGAGVESIPIGIHLSRTGQQFASSPIN